MKRFYRTYYNGNLLSYEISYKESDIFISSCLCDRFEIFQYLRHLRIELERYIAANKSFLTALSPIKFDKNAPSVAQNMIKASCEAGVGPMAAVAGAFAEKIGNFISKKCEECIVENGGDIFLKLNKEAKIGIFTKNKYFQDKLKIKLPKSDKPFGVCSSSSKLGPSLSYGDADLSLIVSHNAALSDALATACANIIKSTQDIKKAMDFVKNKNITGCIFIKDKTLGIWGDLSLCKK